MKPKVCIEFQDGTNTSTMNLVFERGNNTDQ